MYSVKIIIFILTLTQIYYLKHPLNKVSVTYFNHFRKLLYRLTPHSVLGQHQLKKSLRKLECLMNEHLLSVFINNNFN